MDGELLKVLASDSRRDILRLLRKRRMTLTELAAALDLKKATVLEHLKKLTDVELVKRIDDERLWVYYELTSRGGRVVNPGRTRFYLLMGVAAAALVLGGAIVGIAVLTQQGAPDTFDARTGDAASPPAGAGVSVDLRIEEGASSATRAYLLTAEDAEQLRTSSGAVVGIPLELEDARGDVARFRSLSGVPPGDYYLYVVDEEGRDNLDSLSAVRVPSLLIEAPQRAWQGLDGAVTFSLTRDGVPATGTLLLAAGDGGELPTLTLDNGTAILDSTTLDKLVPTTYVLQYLPTDSLVWISLDRTFIVSKPLDALWPLYAVEGEDATFRFAVSPPNVDPPAKVSVEADGDGVLDERGSPEVAFSHAPRDAGTLAVALGRLPPHTVEIVPDLDVTVEGGENATLQVTRAGAPVPDIAVGLGSRVLDVTDAEGRVRFAAPAPGAYELRLVQPDGTTVHRALRYDGEEFKEEPDRVHVKDTRAERVPGGVRAESVIVNEGAALEKLTVALLIDGRTVATSAVEVPADAEFPVTLEASVPLAPGEHAIGVQALSLRQPLTREQEDAPPVAASPAAPMGSADPAGHNDGTTFLSVEDPQPAPVLHEVRLEPRTTGATPATAAGPATPVPEAKTPGPGVALIVAALVVGLALARRRR